MTLASTEEVKTMSTAEQPDGASRRWVLAFGCYLIILNLALLYLLIKLWPGVVPLKDDYSSVRLLPGLPEVKIWKETRFLLIVTLSGALGSYIHLATSFADYLGNRQFMKSWAWWYILRPFIGTVLALVFYFAVRGGLIAGSSGAENLSPYGIAALAGLAGMFSKQATDKMREVFENLVKTDKTPRANPLKQEPAANGEQSAK
jgi:hypothetical protein